MSEKLVWIDLETGGLVGPLNGEVEGVDANIDGAEYYLILEVGVQVTDGDLNPVGDGLELVVFHTQQSLKDHVSPWSKKQFKDTLMIECMDPKKPDLREAERQIIDHLKEQGVKPQESPLCGNSIFLDRRFIQVQMPTLNAFLHYRQLDVSSFAEAIKRWHPVSFRNAPEKKGGHRAIQDIHESIRELAYYKNSIMS